MILSKKWRSILTATLPFLISRPWSIPSVFSLIFGTFFATSLLNGQSPSALTPSASLPLSEFRPLPRLKVNQTLLQSAKLPVIDIHTHFQIRLRHDPTAFANFLEVMNRNRIAVCISLDGTLGPKLTDHLEFLNQRAPNRFAVFANIDFIGRGDKARPETWDCNQTDFVRQTCEQLRVAQRLGVVGLKFFKQFGLEYRNGDGSLIAIDDPRFDPIWQTCGDLHFPIIMHTADPSAFFLPIDKTNERFEELARHPDWAFPAEKFPARETLHAARNRVIAKHPHTIFIAAHLANDGEDLEATGQLLDTYPNLFVEIASRIAELGRQPFTARKFLMKYQDRVLFGTDGPWPEERLRLYWRFLETDDEYFPYSEKEFPPQGFWNIYGVQLPEEVLSKIYRDNALQILPTLKDRYAEALKEMK